MKHIIVGTAGHIDHGKTALVKALTGIDADRLPEEKSAAASPSISALRICNSPPRSVSVLWMYRATNASSKTCSPVWAASIWSSS